MRIKVFIHLSIHLRVPLYTYILKYLLTIINTSTYSLLYIPLHSFLRTYHIYLRTYLPIYILVSIHSLFSIRPEQSPRRPSGGISARHQPNPEKLRHHLPWAPRPCCAQGTTRGSAAHAHVCLSSATCASLPSCFFRMGNEEKCQGCL